MLNLLSFTFWLQYLDIFYWYLAILLDTLSLISSWQSRFVLSCSFLVSSLKNSLLMLVNPTSIGITASVLYVKLNSVSLVGVLVMVLQAQRTLGSSSGHAPFAPSSQTLMAFSKVRLVTSVCPLAYGCPGDEKWFLISSLVQKYLNAWLSNFLPLSDMIILGMPNLQTMFFHIKLCTFASVIVARASASTHFVKQSIATSKNFTCF